MKLKFHAKFGHVVAWSDQNRVGQPRRYIGRTTTQSTEGFLHPAVEAPVEIDSESREGMKVRRLFLIEQDGGPLWPADEETANALGVKFQPVRFSKNINEWMPFDPEAKVKAKEVSAQ